MSEKEQKVRIQQKHDVEANWIKATSFVPKAGEIIIYDTDDIHLQPRIKVGNGTTAVNDLDFTVPTEVSAFTNDAGYLTEAEMIAYIEEAILGGAW